MVTVLPILTSDKRTETFSCDPLSLEGSHHHVGSVLDNLNKLLVDLLIYRLWNALVIQLRRELHLVKN